MRDGISSLTKGQWPALFIAIISSLSFMLTACQAGDEWLTKGRGDENVQALETGVVPDVQPVDAAQPGIVDGGESSAEKYYKRGTKYKPADKALSEEFEKAEKELKAAEESVEKKNKALQELEKWQKAAAAAAAKNIEKLEISFWIGDNEGNATMLPLSVQFCKTTNQCTDKAGLPTTSFGIPPPPKENVYMAQQTGYYAEGDSLDTFLISGTTLPSNPLYGITKDNLKTTRLCIDEGDDEVGINTIVVTVNDKIWCNNPNSLELNNGDCKFVCGAPADAAEGIEPEPLQVIVDGQKEVTAAFKAADAIAGIDPKTDDLYPNSVLAQLNDDIDAKKSTFNSTGDECFNKQVQELTKRKDDVSLAFTRASTAALKAEGYLLSMKIEYLTSMKENKIINDKTMKDGEKNIHIYKDKAIEQKTIATDLYDCPLTVSCTAPVQ